MTDWRDLLERELDLPASGVDAEAAAGVVKYLVLLSRWTKATNLVATTTSPRELVVHHVADCLALLPHLGDAHRVIDVGSGGGLPGAVLALVRPALMVTALEPVHKKHAFLAHLRRDLALENFTPLAERDEQHRGRPDFSPYDLAVSRAAFPIADWLSRAHHLVRPGGRILAMEGRERHPLPPTAVRHPYTLATRARAIIEMPR
jgi:16S rRNA (guanine527-N7)-methyltransferase